MTCLAFFFDDADMYSEVEQCLTNMVEDHNPAQTPPELALRKNPSKPPMSMSSDMPIGAEMDEMDQKMMVCEMLELLGCYDEPNKGGVGSVGCIVRSQI